MPAAAAQEAQVVDDKGVIWCHAVRANGQDLDHACLCHDAAKALVDPWALAHNNAVARTQQATVLGLQRGQTPGMQDALGQQAA